MENINFEHIQGKGFHITDFPDAEKVISLNNLKAQELSDIALCLSDFKNASKCLKMVSDVTKTDFEQTIFWKMSIIYFLRSFGFNSSRITQLKIADILGTDVMGQEVFQFFRDLRDKNIAHDENPFLQCLVGAIVNKPNSIHKVEKIVTMIISSEMHADENITNLMLLIEQSRVYVEKKYDQLCSELTGELENFTYFDLIQKSQLEFVVPTAEKVSDNRIS